MNNYNNKMSARFDKQNDFPSSLDLDFKKTNYKSKPNTERTKFLETRKSMEISSATISLIQKKKMYSQALRQKNINKKSKVDLSEQKGLVSSGGSSMVVKTLSKSNNNSRSFLCEPQSHILTEINNNSNTKDSLRSKGKKKIVSMAITSFESYGLDNTNSAQKDQVLQLSPVFQKVIFGKKLQICRQQSIVILASESQKAKEFQMLQKHNATFKRQLASFRKDNSTLKRQLDAIKDHLSAQKNQNSQLIAQHQQHIKVVEELNEKISQLTRNQGVTVVLRGTAQEDQQQLKQILANYEARVFEANSINKKLELKNYMLEKRLTDQTDKHRKQMAKQLGLWKDRYIKVRNENLRMKDHRNSIFEVSFSEQLGTE